MNLQKALGRKLFRVIPAYNRNLYEFCVRYVDRFNGDNDTNPELNGEYLFLRNELSRLESGVVFDIGANVGDWTSFAFSINPKVNFHCFEPSKAVFETLAHKEWHSNVRLNNLGMGEAEGVLDLHVVDEKSALNSVYLRRGVASARAVKTEAIRITTMDRYCEENAIRNIDLLKIDVEGHELAVLKGMSNMLALEAIRAIQFEYGGCNLDAKAYLGDIWYFLAPYGFKFYKLSPAGPRFVEEYEQKLETFKYSNWVAVHRTHHSM